MNSYSMTYTFDGKKPLKTALLVLALGVDIVNLTFLISAAGGDYIKFAYLAVGIALMFALRLPTLKMTYCVKYDFKDGFSVKRIYQHKEELVLYLCGEFDLIEVNDESALSEDAVRLFSCRQDNPLIVIKTQGMSYVIAPDEYMLALILSFYGKTINKNGY